MPLKLERSLQAGARKHHFKRGSKRYNAYVYGTMQHNHAGNLGPDKMFKIKRSHFDYKPTVDHVHGIHIAIVVAILLLVYWHFARDGMSLYAIGGGLKNGTGAATYTDVQSYSGWMSYQYNPLGANAGALNGEAN